VFKHYFTIKANMFRSNIIVTSTIIPYKLICREENDRGFIVIAIGYRRNN